MYNGNKIKQLLAERNILNKELLNYLGSDANATLTQIVNGNPTVKRLEKVADFFGVSMDVFFNREKPFMCSNNENKINVYELTQKNDFLEKLILEKDKRIELLESMNKLLTSSIKSDNTQTEKMK